ncbi:MFS general substrate transporter, partial [Aureobasidium melanogenum]
FSFKSFVRDSLFRPLKFLVTEPIVFFCSALCAIAFGLIYGLTEGLTVAYTNPPFSRTFSQTSSSLSFIAILIGILLDVLPRFYDDYLFKKFRKQKRRLLPETKITSFALACPALAIGLWIFAWTIPPRVTDVHWVVSMVGLAFVGFATADLSYVLFGYCTDTYGPMAASAVSSLSTCRTIAASVFPLFAYQMFSGLGANVAASILAAVATIFAFTPILFLKYGHTLRRKSKVAAADEDCLVEENKHMEDDSSEGEKEKKPEDV